MNSQDIESEFTSKTYTSRDLRLSDPKWLEIWPQIRDDYGCETGLCLEISCTYRSPKAQNDIWKMAATKGIWLTDFDGIEKLSVHNIFPSKALDVYPHMAGKIMPIWDIDVFEPIGKLAEKYGLRWGGNWSGKKKDRPHLELP